MCMWETDCDFEGVLQKGEEGEEKNVKVVILHFIFS